MSNRFGSGSTAAFGAATTPSFHNNNINNSTRDAQGGTGGGGGGGAGLTSAIRGATQHRLQQQQQQQIMQSESVPAPITGREEDFANAHADNAWFGGREDQSFSAGNEAKVQELLHTLVGPHLAQTGWASSLSVAENIFRTKILPFFVLCGHPEPPYPFRLFNGVGYPRSVVPPLHEPTNCGPTSNHQSSHATQQQQQQRQQQQQQQQQNRAASAAVYDTQHREQLLEQFETERRKRDVIFQSALRGMQALIMLFPRQQLGHALDVLSAAELNSNNNNQSARRSRGAKNSAAANFLMQQQQQAALDYPIKIKCSVGAGRDRVYMVGSHAIASGRHCTCYAFRHHVLSFSSMPTCKHILALNLAFGFLVPATPPPPPTTTSSLQGLVGGGDDASNCFFWTELPPSPDVPRVSQQPHQPQNNNNVFDDDAEERPLFVEEEQQQQQQQKKTDDDSESIHNSSVDGGSGALRDPTRPIFVAEGSAVAWFPATENEVFELLTCEF